MYTYRNKRGESMTEDIEEAFDYAKRIIDDEGVFSVDQIVLLQSMLYVIKLGVIQLNSCKTEKWCIINK